MSTGFHPDHEAEESLLTAIEKARLTGSDYPDIEIPLLVQEAEECRKCQADPGGAPIPTAFRHMHHRHAVWLVDRLLVILAGPKPWNASRQLRATGASEEEVRAALDYARAAGYTETSGDGLNRLTPAGRAAAVTGLG